MNAIVYPAGGPTPAAFALDSNGNILANVNLRTDTAANLAGVTGGASELAYASDTVTIGAQLGTGQLVMMGTGVTHAKTFYSGTAMAQMGLGQPIFTASTGDVLIASATTVSGGFNTIYGQPLPGLGGVIFTAGFGSSISLGANYASVFGYQAKASLPYVLTVSNSNQIGGLNPGDFVYGNDAFHAATAMPVIKGSTHLHGTTTNATALALTLDAAAASVPLAVPTAPTAAPAGIAGSGSLPIGTYYVAVTYTNNVGETKISLRTTVTTTLLNDSIVVTSPAGSGNATGYKTYIGTVTTFVYSILPTPQSLGVGDTIYALNPTNNIRGTSVQDSSSNQFSFSQLGASAIGTLRVKIFGRAVTGTTAFIGVREIDFSVTGGNAAVSQYGNTIGTDTNGIAGFVPTTAFSFAADNTNKLITLTVTATGVAADTINWTAVIDYDAVRI